ncbi:hypothetical protein XCR1_2760007 [Xenorhabdus cabanillasii JM26]|uniref:Uncharacterized protein n=1 Tax=Xenorhabdus cabanillasii JM26 TaxID=1427517 RepID=W1J9H0_9GAMM|nr:hypothetical protein XCR1_2760007 [Xenorhabdus cabanillasii JM26]
MKPIARSFTHNNTVLKSISEISQSKSMTKIRDYSKLANDILREVGGQNNLIIFLAVQLG